MSLGQTIRNTGAGLTRAIDAECVTAALLDAAFHAIADCHDRALEIDLDGGTVNSLQASADLVTTMQTANFATPEAVALVGCFLESLGEYVQALENDTPVPECGVGAVILKFPPRIGGDAA